MTAEFETSVEQHALDYIKLHLREGYTVIASMGKGKYYWEEVYKIKVSKEGTDDETD